MHWLSRLPARPVTRFAPSPTGELHLGHVAHALWVWGVARHTGGTVLLRMEDHDRGRSRREYEGRILADLEWLGLEPDATCLASIRAEIPSPWRQSDNQAAYEAALGRLRSATLVYGCTCSRAQIARSVDMGQAAGGVEIPYPGSCRNRGLAPGTGGAGIRAVLPADAVPFEDLRLGVQRQVPATQCGDLLLRDAAGNWTYQYAVTVDDLRHGVTLVVRGEDLLDSTGRQLLLASLLGRPTAPAVLHHPLLVNEAGRKLSKKDAALSLRALREGGATPAAVRHEAATRSGLPRELG